MTGSLQKKKDSKYYYAVLSYFNENGNRKQKWESTKCTSKSEAKKYLSDRLYEYSHGITSITLSKTLFVDFIDNWLNTVIKNQVEQTTYDGYVTNISKHIIPYFRPKRLLLKDLKPIHLQEYFNKKFMSGETGGLSANTLRKHYANMKKALNYAVNMELIDKNPADKVTLPKIKSYSPQILNPVQISTLLKAVKSTTIETAVYLAANLGLRRGEALGLRWKDIDFEQGELYILNTRTRVDHEVEKGPKSKAGKRCLSIGKTLMGYLKELHVKQKENQLLFGEAYNKNDYVCKGEDGTPLNINSVSRLFKKVLAKNNLPDIRFHDLRHNAASLLHQSGATPKQTQIFLGHSDISTTMGTYVHVFKESDKDVAQRMDALIYNMR